MEHARIRSGVAYTQRGDGSTLPPERTTSETTHDFGKRGFSFFLAAPRTVVHGGAERGARHAEAHGRARQVRQRVRRRLGARHALSLWLLPLFPLSRLGDCERPLDEQPQKVSCRRADCAARSCIASVKKWPQISKGRTSLVGDTATHTPHPLRVSFTFGEAA
jgi:hypothetical protein